MAKTNKFHVKEIKDEVNYTVEEERKDRSPIYWFLKRNIWLIYGIVMFISIIISTITIYAVSKNIKGSTKVEYSDNGVTVTFDEGNNSILNGTPITESYASKLFDGTLANDLNKGVVKSIIENRTAIKGITSNDEGNTITNLGNILALLEDSLVKASATEQLEIPMMAVKNILAAA